MLVTCSEITAGLPTAQWVISMLLSLLFLGMLFIEMADGVSCCHDYPGELGSLVRRKLIL